MVKIQLHSVHFQSVVFFLQFISMSIRIATEAMSVFIGKMLKTGLNLNVKR